MGQPTDRITLTPEQAKTLYELWVGSAYKDEIEEDEMFCPSDLFFSDTIPLRDCIIDGRLVEGDYPVEVEYHVLDEYPQYDMSEYFKEKDIEAIGIVFMEIKIRYRDINDKAMLIEALIGGAKGLNFTEVWNTPVIHINGKELDLEHCRLTEVGLSALMGTRFYIRHCLRVWYSVQVALLHPQIKEVFSHPRKIKEKIPKAEWKANGQKTYRYVKYHVIQSEELEDMVFGKGERHRHALCWYVTGHWRHYKSGKTAFIKGFWKGALRATKKAETRNREIPVEATA